MERRHFLRRTTAAGATALAAGTLTAAAVNTGTATAMTTGKTTAAPRRTGPLRVDIVMFDGVEELDCIAPYEVFSTSAMHSAGGVRVRYVTTGRLGAVRAAYGTEIRVAHRWAPEEADVIVVPGGGYSRRDGPGIWAEIDSGVLPRALAAAPREGLTVTSLCTGALLLSAAGLTKGRPCTTHHGAKADLAAQGGIVKNARVVDDGDLVTAGGHLLGPGVGPVAGQTRTRGGRGDWGGGHAGVRGARHGLDGVLAVAQGGRVRAVHTAGSRAVHAAGTARCSHGGTACRSHGEAAWAPSEPGARRRGAPLPVLLLPEWPRPPGSAGLLSGRVVTRRT
ncbi:DJ-1/PfpI family protein [Streptomyces hygroscopicus]|uniref:DJ-1/PfpI family protein n=1 Tax=Streptomyces hygroscopicus TaxID=1912 RepID=UPI0033D95D70